MLAVDQRNELSVHMVHRNSGGCGRTVAVGALGLWAHDGCGPKNDSVRADGKLGECNARIPLEDANACMEGVLRQWAWHCIGAQM